MCACEAQCAHRWLQARYELTITAQQHLALETRILLPSITSNEAECQLGPVGWALPPGAVQTGARSTVSSMDGTQACTRLTSADAVVSTSSAVSAEPYQLSC